jgi:hypothetical protein
MAAKDKDRSPAAGGGTGKVQGEGDYEAARRYDEKLRDHVKNHDVDKEARDAEPSSPAEERELEHAEQKGKRRAKGEDPLLERPEDIESADNDKSSRR